MASTSPPTGGFIDHALEYAGFHNWQVLPLLPRTKRPFLDGWQNLATADEDQICEWWEQNPDCNIGVKLGPGSNLVDIEIDGNTPEETKLAEERLFELFGGEIPSTPTYRSRRGKHRLFRWSAALPEPGKNGFKICDGLIEFRTGNGNKGCQSAMPPSVHPDTGEAYRWEPGLSPRSCEPAEIPDHVMARIITWYGEGHAGGPVSDRGPSRDWIEVASSGSREGDRNNTTASYVGKLINSMKDPWDNSHCQIVLEQVLTWNEAKNRPPLPDNEITRTFNSILNRHRERVASDEEVQQVERYRDPGPKGTGSRAEWRLVRVESEPVKWKLFSPLWETKAPGGCVILSSYQMQSWSRIATAALEQASVWIAHPTFKKMWHGDGKAQTPALQEGLARRLIENCDTEEAQPEEIRSHVVAQYVWECLCMARARVLEEPDDKGRPTQLDDGTIVVKFQTLLALLQQNVDPPKQSELLDLLRSVGVQGAKLFRVAGSRSRYHVFDKKHQQALEAIVTSRAIE